jgi:hypothetical protein
LVRVRDPEREALFGRRLSERGVRTDEEAQHTLTYAVRLAHSTRIVCRGSVDNGVRNQHLQIQHMDHHQYRHFQLSNRPEDSRARKGRVRPFPSSALLKANNTPAEPVARSMDSRIS